MCGATAAERLFIRLGVIRTIQSRQSPQDEGAAIAKKKRGKSIDEWIEALQPEVAYCYNCQPRESGEYIWVLGNQIEMTDFLMDQGVPESKREDVANGLYCLNCGTEQDLTSEVGQKSAEEELADEQWDQWRSEYAPKLEEFVDWLTKYPYLGTDHPLGREFLEQIAEFPTSTFTRERWWRARRVEGPSRLVPKDMGPPPKPPRSEGRYNHHGQRVFYLASSKEDAAAEVLGDGECLSWVQEFEIRDRSKLLDLTAPMAHEDMGAIPILLAGLAWSRAHMASDDPDSEWKPQYFLPRFIADCARRHRFRGIVFDSPKHYGENLVLFRWKRSDIIEVGDPTLLDWQPPSEEDMPF